MVGAPTVEDVVGTVTHGTLKPGDLLTAFFDQLQVLDGERARGIRKDYANVFTHLSDLDHEWTVGSEADEQALIIDAGECFETLYDALNENAPEGLFFGSHPGDGSDFGFWPIPSQTEIHGEIRQHLRSAMEGE